MHPIYNHWLVGLSIVVAVLVSYTALSLAARVAAAGAGYARFWLVGGALAMGVGTWSMHFIGMMAYTLPIALRYDVATTVLSLAAAILTSGCAIRIAAGARLDSSRMGEELCVPPADGARRRRSDARIRPSEELVLFEEASLLARTGGDSQFARELIELFVESSRDTLSRLAEAIPAAGNAEAVRRLAHGLKGAAATTSAGAMASAAAELERAAGQASASDSLAKLEAVTARTIEEWQRTRWLACGQDKPGTDLAQSSPN